MAKVEGIVEQFSEVRRSSYGSWNIGVKIGKTWFNLYDKDDANVKTFSGAYPVGSKVEVTFDESKGYKPIKEMKLLVPVADQATLKELESNGTASTRESKAARTTKLEDGITGELRSPRQDIAECLLLAKDTVEKLQAILNNLKEVE